MNKKSDEQRVTGQPVTNHLGELSQVFSRLAKELEMLGEEMKRKEALITENERLHQAYQQNEKLVNQLLRTSEEEKRQLSNDVYHAIGQTIYSLFIGIRMVMNLDIEPTVKQHLRELEKVTDEALAKVRDLSFDLHPFMIEDLGLPETIRSFLRKIKEQFNRDLELFITGKHRPVPLEIEHGLFRICREVVSFLCTHPSLEKLELTLRYTETREVQLGLAASFFAKVAAASIEEMLLLATKRTELLDGALTWTETPDQHHLTIMIAIPEK